MIYCFVSLTTYYYYPCYYYYYYYYYCWLTKRLEKKLDGNYTRMLRAVLNKSWRQHPTRHQLYGHLPPITKTIQVRRTRHAGHCWRSKDELISDVLLWTPTYGCAKAGRPARCPRGVMVKAMNCGIVVREFVLQSRYYVHISGKYPWERYEPPYSPSSYG